MPGGIPSQNFPVPFGQGLDAKTDPKVLPPGKLTRLENLVFDIGGTLIKRNGYRKITGPPVSGLSLAQNGAVYQDKELDQFNGKHQWAYVPEVNEWIDKGPCRSINLSVADIANTSTAQTLPCSASVNGITVFVWQAGKGGSGVFATVVDEASGVVIQDAVSLDSSGSRPRVVASAGQIVVFWEVLKETNIIRRSVLNSLVPQSFGAATPVRSIDPSGIYSVSVTATGMALALNYTGSVVLVALDPSGVQLALPAPVVVIAETAVALSVCVTSAAHIVVAVVNPGPPNSVTVSAFTSALVLVHQSGATDPETSITNITCCESGIAGPDPLIDVFYEVAAISGSVTTTRVNSFLWNLTLNVVVSGPGVFCRSVGLGSEAFLYDGTAFVGLVYQSPIQGTWFLAADTGRVVVRALRGRAAGLTESPFLPSVATTGSGQFAIAVQVQPPLQNGPNGIQQGHDGLARVSLDIAGERFRSSQLGKDLFIAGACPLDYDSTGTVEHGFNVFPEGLTGQGGSAIGVQVLTPGGPNNSPAQVVQITLPPDVAGVDGSAQTSASQIAPGSWIAIPDAYSHPDSIPLVWPIFYVWFTVDGDGTDPAPFTTGQAVLCAIASTDSGAQVAAKLTAALTTPPTAGTTKTVAVNVDSPVSLTVTYTTTPTPGANSWLPPPPSTGGSMAAEVVRAANDTTETKQWLASTDYLAGAEVINVGIIPFDVGIVQVGAQIVAPGGPGNGASLTGVNSDHSVQVWNLSGMTPASVGHYLKLTGCDTAGNNGTWLITAYANPESVSIIGPPTPIFPLWTADHSNKSIGWQELYDTTKDAQGAITSGGDGPTTLSVPGPAPFTYLHSQATGGVVPPGYYVRIANANKAVNNGLFPIISVNGPGTQIVFNNPFGVGVPDDYGQGGSPGNSTLQYSQFWIGGYVALQGGTSAEPITAAATGTPPIPGTNIPISGPVGQGVVSDGTVVWEWRDPAAQQYLCFPGGSAIPAGSFFTIATSLPYRSGAGGAVAPADAVLSTYLFWFSVDGEGTPPNIGASVAAIEVAVNSTSTPAQVGAAVAAAFAGPALTVAFPASNEQLFNVTANGAELLITSPPAVPVSTLFFLTPPTPVVSGIGGALVPGIREYVATYLWTDAQGQVHESAPSAPLTVQTGYPSGQNHLTLPTLRITSKQNVYVALYRTVANQPNLQLVALIANGQQPPFSPVSPNGGADAVSFVDNVTDASLGNASFLYTVGGALPNFPPNGASVVTQRGDRLWMPDPENPQQVFYSKQWFKGSPVNFNPELAIEIDLLGGRIVALGVLDGNLIVFKESRILLITGDGPDDTGGNGTFSDPQVISADTGCSSADSLVQTPDGLVFQTDKGVYLLNRGLQLEPIGYPVVSIQNNTVQGVTLLPKCQRLMFVFASGVGLLYDYYYKQWGTTTSQLPQGTTPGAGLNGVSGIVWQGLHTITRQDGCVMQEMPTDPLVAQDDVAPIQFTVTGSWLQPFGPQGFGRVRKFTLLGALLSPCQIQMSVEISFEAGTIVWGPFQIDSQQLIDGTYGASSPFGGEVIYGDGGGDGVLEISGWPYPQKCTSTRYTFQDVGPASGGDATGQSYSLTMLSLDVAPYPGTVRVPQNKRVVG